MKLGPGEHESQLSAAERALDRLSNLGADGLYATPPGSINWHPFDNAQGEDTHTNAVLYRALLAAADLERRVGGGEVAARADERIAASVRQAMLDRLWDPSARAFVLNSQDPSNHTQDAQVEAVLDGLLPGPQADSALLSSTPIYTPPTACETANRTRTRT